jgi:hypothetical protein
MMVSSGVIQYAGAFPKVRSVIIGIDSSQSQRNTDDSGMTPDQLRHLLDEIRSGAIDPDLAHQKLLATLRAQPFEDLGFAKVDHHRSVRGVSRGHPGLGKNLNRSRRSPNRS